MPSELMPRAAPDLSHRAQLTEMMDEPCSREELRSCLRDLARLNRWFLGNRPILQWLGTVIPDRTTGPIRILDVGCGDGEGLRTIARWARSRGTQVELMGLDINPETIAIAAEATAPELAIEWIAADIFSHTPRRPLHLVVSSLFTHHLQNEQVVQFLQWMDLHAQRGWFVNDLSRNLVPYHFLRIFTRLARLHPIVQNDAPVSVERAFIQEDWQILCSAAGFASRHVTIRAFTPARVCVYCNKSS